MEKVEVRFFQGRRYARYPHAKKKDKQRYFVCIERGVARSLHRDVWESVHGPVPEGHHVHHKNGWDKNDIDDLECLSAADHHRLHADVHGSARLATCPGPNDEPLDPRDRRAHPEVIEAGDRRYERGDIAAKKYCESERSANRRDRLGAPHIYIAGIKYRPQPDYDDFIASTIRQHKPQPPKRRERA